MAGHSTRNWMNGVLHSDSPFFQIRGELSHRVLGLGDSETISGYDHDAPRIRERDGSVLGGRLANGTACACGRGGGIGGSRTECAEEDVGN